MTEPPWGLVRNLLFTQRIRHANLFFVKSVPNDFPENTSAENQRKPAGNYRKTLENKILYSFLTRAVPMRGSGSLNLFLSVQLTHLEKIGLTINISAPTPANLPRLPWRWQNLSC
jgi:hypothetical protein